MKPDQFHPDRSPGRLARIRFEDARVFGGRLERRVIEGWSFIPSPPPTLADLSPSLLGLMPQLEATSTALGRVTGAFTTQPESLNVDPRVLFRSLLTREARLSSTIENTIASPREIAVQELAGDTTASREDAREVANYLRAVERAHAGAWPINETTIRTMHADLLDGLSDAGAKLPGRYRTGDVYLGNRQNGFAGARFVPPPAAEVAPLMTDLSAYIQSPPAGLPALIAIAAAHYQFETIHPFTDGNGRLGRMLITLSLCAHGLLNDPIIYPSVYFEANRQEYYDALLRVSTHGDWARWIALFLEAVRSQAEDATRRMSGLLALRATYRTRLEDRRVHHRILQLVDHLFASPAISVKRAHKLLGGSPQTARSYIQLLVENGTLIEITGRGKDRVYLAYEVLQVADDDTGEM